MVEERYQRLKQLGQGITSAVWLARDTYTQELVAFKIMTALYGRDSQNKKARERFLREIEIASRLQHPHVLPVIDYGYTIYEDHSVPYLVCPYIQEGSLADLIDEQPPWQYWSLIQTADVIMQAAESLWYLHNGTPQIVHQDIKPGNFLYHLVNTSQRAVYLYLCDFGISRLLDSALTNEVLGTFAYIAPEQIERQVNCASDQYALAVMACYLLTGELPLQAENKDLYVHAHLYEPPIPPSRLNPERITLPAIDAIILRALEKKPEQRFPTVIAFARALQQAIMEPVSEQTEGLRAPPDTHLEPPVPIVLDPPEAYADHLLDEPLPSRPLKVMSGPAVCFSLTPTLLPFHTIARIMLPARPRMLCWSPAGKALACVLYGRVPHIIAHNGSKLEIFEVRTINAESASCVCWSPDGRVLAVSSQGEIRFWDVVSQSPLPLILPFDVRAIDGLSWSATNNLAAWVNSQLVIYPLSRVELSMTQLPSARSVDTGAMRCGNVGVLSWSPDGFLLAAGAANGTIMCWSFAGDKRVLRVAEPGQKVNSLCWSSDGTLLVAAFRNNRIVGWDISMKQIVFQWEKLPVMPRAVSISSRSRIAIASGEKQLLFGSPDDTAPHSMLPGQMLVSWSPTRSELSTLDERQETSLVLWRE